jgi:hypothetical protein
MSSCLASVVSRILEWSCNFIKILLSVSLIVVSVSVMGMDEEVTILGLDSW